MKRVEADRGGIFKKSIGGLTDTPEGKRYIVVMNFGALRDACRFLEARDNLCRKTGERCKPGLCPLIKR